MDTHEEFQDRIQRAKNTLKRKELERKYGARFAYNEADASPAIIGQWLECVEEFERLTRAAGRTTVRAFAGNPHYPPPSTLSPRRVSQELRALLNHLGAHAIAVHFDRTVPPEEAYRFIVEELLDHQMDNVRIKGLTHNFTYGNFHPDRPERARMTGARFLGALLDADGDGCTQVAAGCPLDQPGGKIERSIRAFHGAVAAFTTSEVKALDCSVEGDTAHARFSVSWTGLRSQSMAPLSGSGIASVWLHHSGAGWKVVQFTCPGCEVL
ncbi:MAG TPA: hypothetical protein VL126_10440 [Bacteroidota bacterium]|nr:hypothetical protein [Bacteroidota bacterium]